MMQLFLDSVCLWHLCTTRLVQYYFVLQSLHKVFPGTTSYYKACTKYFPVLLRTTKLAQGISLYYLVLPSIALLDLRKILPSTTSYYKAYTKYVPVLLRNTKLAQKGLPTTTSYYKAYTKYVPVLLRNTKLAQKGLPTTTSYYKACTKVLPSTTLYDNTCAKYFPVIWSCNDVVISGVVLVMWWCVDDAVMLWCCWLW